MAQLKGDIPSVLPSPGKQNGNFRNDLILIIEFEDKKQFAKVFFLKLNKTFFKNLLNSKLLKMLKINLWQARAL